MEGECMVVLDTMIDKDTEKQATQEIKPRSKLTMALLAFTLCLAATAVAALVVNRRAEVGLKYSLNYIRAPLTLTVNELLHLKPTSL